MRVGEADKGVSETGVNGIEALGVGEVKVEDEVDA